MANMLSYDHLYDDYDLPILDGGRVLDISQLIVANFDWAMSERPVGVSYFIWGWAVEVYTWRNDVLSTTAGAPDEYNIGRICTGLLDSRTSPRYFWSEKTPWIWLRQSMKEPLQAVMVNQSKKSSFLAYPENWPYPGASPEAIIVPTGKRSHILGLYAKPSVRFRLWISIAFNVRATQVPPAYYVYF